MSSRARRLDNAAVQPFPWVTNTDGRVAPVLPAQPAPVPVAEPASHDAQRAALEREAFTKGFAQGERAGAEAAAQRGEAMLRRLTETLEELTTVRQQMIDQTERQIVQLALAIARRIIRREISLDHDLLVAMARVALDRLGEHAQATVRLNPEDFELTTAARSSAWTGTHVTVVADARIARGGCRVESEFGAIAAGADDQIQEIARALLGEAA